MRVFRVEPICDNTTSNSRHGFQGADPLAGHSKDYYTALHFAALSGNPEICSMLLQAGARDYQTTGIKGGERTANQMAGFVGLYIWEAAL